MAPLRVRHRGVPNAPNRLPFEPPWFDAEEEHVPDTEVEGFPDERQVRIRYLDEQFDIAPDLDIGAVPRFGRVRPCQQI